MLIYKIVVIFRNLYFILLEFSGNLKYLALLFSCPNNNYTVNYLDLLPSTTYLLYFIISLVIANLYIFRTKYRYFEQEFVCHKV